MEPTDAGAQVTEAVGTAWDKVAGWIETAIAMLPNFIVAVVALIAFVVIARILRRLLAGLLARTLDSRPVARLIETIAYISVVAIGIFVALSVLQLEGAVTSLLAGVGIIGLALGFAFQDIAANFVSGVLLAIRKPFTEGEIITVSGISGKVMEINLRTTVIRQFDGPLVFVPNKEVFSASIHNTYRMRERRVDIPCGIAYDSDLELVRTTALAVAGAVSQRDKARDPEFFYTGFGDSSIDFVLRFWTLNDGDDPLFFQARSEAIVALKAAFDKASITIPFPIRTLDVGTSLGKLVTSVTRSGPTAM